MNIYKYINININTYIYIYIHIRDREHKVKKLDSLGKGNICRTRGKV